MNAQITLKVMEAIPPTPQPYLPTPTHPSYDREGLIGSPHTPFHYLPAPQAFRQTCGQRDLLGGKLSLHLW